MGKLDQEVHNAEQDNLATKGIDAAKGKAKSEVKKATKQTTKKAVKKVASKTHSALMAKSGLYRGAVQLATKGVQAVVATAQSVISSVIAFLTTSPIGWLVSAILIVLVIAIIGSSTANKGNYAYAETEIYMDDSSLTNEERMMLVIDTCPTPTSNPGEVPSGEIGDSDWTTPGTTAYNNAKNIFTHWVNKGLSGAAAAGIVGWVNSEGGFAMLGRAEGFYGQNIQENSIKYGNEPIPSTSNYDVGGGGVYQFTPYTKYAPLNSPDWEDAAKMNAFVGTSIMNGSWNASMDLTGGNNTFQSMAQQIDPQYATLIWQAYERGDVAHINQAQKKADAQRAYDMFNGANYTYNEEVFASNFGGSGEPATPSEGVVNPCGQVSGGTWGPSGGQPATNSGIWRHNELPADLKEYALNPMSVGLSFGTVDGWNAIAYDGTQCTDLAASLMFAIWHKNGEHPRQVRGNGADVANNWASSFGGSTTSQPSGGAVFSDPNLSIYGHTGVVSHVFDNGDFLVVEQNVRGYSGESNGMMYSWNYRYVSSSEGSSYLFYNPEQAGYTFVDNIKSM